MFAAREVGEYFVVRRVGLLILIHVSVGGTLRTSSAGMGMADWGGFSSFSASAFETTSVFGNDAVRTAEVVDWRGSEIPPRSGCYVHTIYVRSG